MEEVVSRTKSRRVDPAISTSSVTSILLEDLERSGVRDANTDFLCEQLQLVHSPPITQRYSQLTLKVATELFSSSPNAYKVSRSNLILPNPSTLRDKVGPINDIGSVDEARTTLHHVFQNFSGLQK